MKMIIRTVILLAFVAMGEYTYAGQAQKDDQPDTTKSGQHLQSGLKKLRAKKYAEAVTDFSKAIGENKKNWRAYRFRADAEDGLDDYKSSISDYTTALQLKPSDTLSYRGRAEAKRHSNDFEGALKDYDVALSYNPNDTFIRFGRALCLYHSKQYKAVIEDLNIFIRDWKWTSDQSYRDAFRLRGESLVNVAEYRSAIRDLDQYFKLGGKKENGIIYRGIAYFYLGGDNILNADSAIIDLKIGASFYPKSITPPYYLGLAYIVKNELKLAEQSLQKALAIDPNDIDVVYSMIKVKSYQKDYQSEYELFQKYLKLKPKLDNGDEYYFLGLAKWGAKRDTVGAVQAFEKASESGDVDRTMLFNRWVELLLGSIKYAATLKKYITEEIGHTTDSLKTGYLYASRSLVNAQENNSTETKSDIEKATMFAPKSPIIYLVKGALCKSLNLTNEVVLENYDKAIALNGKLPEAYLMKAYFYKQQGDLKKSCENLTKAEELGAKPTDSLKEHLCKGTNLKSSKESELNFVIYPYLREAMIKFK